MKIFYLLLIPVLLLVSCKKEPMTDSLSEVSLNKEGILRIECSDCEVNFSVQATKYNVKIKDGSEDIAFQYLSDFQLETKVASHENQNIRLLVIDSYGRVVSNELQVWGDGETKTSFFEIKTR